MFETISNKNFDIHFLWIYSITFSEKQSNSNSEKKDSFELMKCIYFLSILKLLSFKGSIRRSDYLKLEWFSQLLDVFELNFTLSISFFEDDILFLIWGIMWFGFIRDKISWLLLISQEIFCFFLFYFAVLQIIVPYSFLFKFKKSVAFSFGFTF
jgi:hypothetical protein